MKFKKIVKFVQIRFITPLVSVPVSAKFSNSHNTRYSWEKLLNGNIGQLRTPILTLGKTVKLQAIRTHDHVHELTILELLASQTF